VGRFVTTILDRLINPALIYVVQKFHPELLKDLLEREIKPSCVVRAFSDPKEALQKFASEESRPGLLITGLVLEGMSWMQLLQECKELKPGLKVIAFSSMVRPGIETYFEHEPFKPDAWISKRFDLGIDAILAETQKLIRFRWPNDRA
jgi:CheY-like chemotaxis protein